ncbi:MAG: hypothetical protein QOG03_1367 [Actinomycetota bacterium]|nr:hypothetical protein [Actinomycetota bacterium]
MPVPATVIKAFRLSGEGQQLEGGLGPAFRFGDIVVKPMDDEAEATFIAEVMASVEVDESLVRVARPVAAADGSWFVDGWAASRWVEGRQIRSGHPWPVALAAIDALHTGLRRFPDAGLRRRTHRWAVAARLAWGEEVVDLHPAIDDLVTRLQAREQAIDLESQLIHGDMFSNLLFDDALPPAVIDFSPSWRPAAWATAVYAVDAIAWGGGDEELLDLIGRSETMGQLLLRAAVFRLVALDGYRRELGQDIEPALPEYESMVATVLRQIS